MEVKIVTIPTFVNPHLFWIIESNNERSKILNHINKEMQNDFKSGSTLNDSFEIGEVSNSKCLNAICLY